jgi:hypothetical protein
VTLVTKSLATTIGVVVVKVRYDDGELTTDTNHAQRLSFLLDEVQLDARGNELLPEENPDQVHLQLAEDNFL